MSIYIYIYINIVVVPKRCHQGPKHRTIVMKTDACPQSGKTDLLTPVHFMVDLLL